VAGSDVIECASMEEAVRWAGRHPHSWMGAVEVRALADGASAVHLPAPGAGMTRYMMLVCTDPAVDPQEFARTEPAALIHQTGDWDLAEECAQDAFTQALRRWPHDGVPSRPGAWLMTVARNGAIDRLRRSSTYRAKVEELAVMATRETGTDDNAERDADADDDDGGVPDERLRLIFTCCHPALAMEARVALTLRTLAGLSTAEIARAFLVPEATMAKRLVRAKHTIAHAHPLPGTARQRPAAAGTGGPRGALHDRLARRGAEPGGRGGHGRRPGGRAGAARASGGRRRPGRLLPAARYPGRLSAAPGPQRGSGQRLRGGGCPGRHGPRAPVPERTAGRGQYT
jgi:RNA polymerase sigma factor (sigma-70 family)